MIIRNLLLTIAIIILGNIINESCTQEVKVNHSPMHIHLALTHNIDEMAVSWLTKYPIPLPTVYYFEGDCSTLYEVGKQEMDISSSSSSTESNISMRDEQSPTSSSTSSTPTPTQQQQQQSTEEIKVKIKKVIRKGISIDTISPGYKVAIGDTSTYYSYDGFIHRVVLSKLSQGKSYCYRVGGELQINTTSPMASTWSDEWYSFRTNPTREQKAVLAVFGDSGTWGDVHEVVRAVSHDRDVRLVLHVGDLSYGRTEDVWDKFGTIIEPVSSINPYMTIPGNWDVKEGALLPFTNRYKMPLAMNGPTAQIEMEDDSSRVVERSNNLFYSFEYTHAYIIMLSSYDPYESDSVQFEWLEKELQNSVKLKSRLPWTIVCAHSPMYSSSEGHNGSDMKFREVIEPLFHKYKVNLVISGHDHGYERTYPVFQGEILNNQEKEYGSHDSTIHILGGTGGATADPWLDQPNWSKTRESSSGYTKLIIHKHSLEVTYLRINGTIGDHFIIHDYDVSGSQHTSIIILFLILAVIIFPICAFSRIPARLFRILLQQRDNMSYGKSSLV